MRFALIAGIALTLAGCQRGEPIGSAEWPRSGAGGGQHPIVDAARKQLLRPAVYDASYRKLEYPGGDVDPERGACTDVVIRALRPLGHDLQKLIHEDMARVRYPRAGTRRDRNIDHRRVPNQRFFFSRHGKSLTLRTDRAHAKAWRPGDIVSWKLPSGLDHIGILTDRLNSHGLPYAIHNLSRTAEEDVLTDWTITGHYRYP